MPGDEQLQAPDGFHTRAVYRRENVVVRECGPWAATVHNLLRHLERVGFAGAPQVVEPGFDADGRETLTFIAGEFTQPGPWTHEGAFAVGALLRELHAATATYTPPYNAVWQPWYSRTLGDGPRVIGHCDMGPWNIVARAGRPVALIDWESAGPIDPLVELAEACWLNAKLFDDTVAVREGLPPLNERARHLRAVVDGYGLPVQQRIGFIDLIVEVAIHSTVNEADLARITHNTASSDLARQVPWALAWRVRSAAWMLRHRSVLQNALV